MKDAKSYDELTSSEIKYLLESAETEEEFIKIVTDIDTAIDNLDGALN